MFIPIWMVFLVSGIAMAIYAAWWSIKTRQYEDQDRAAYIPLLDLSEEELNRPAPTGGRAFYYANLVILACGAWALGATLIIVIRSS